MKQSLHLLLPAVLSIIALTVDAQGFARDEGTPAAKRLAGLSPVTESMLIDPPAGDWLMWRRTYDGAGFSPLDQINRQNVSNLETAWHARLESGPNMPTPLVHDGVMYLLSSPDALLTLDATTGELLWSYKHPGSTASAKIGIALHGNMVLVPTSDMHLLALDSRSGDLIWDTRIVSNTADPQSFSLRAAPIVANGMVIQGVTGSTVPGGAFIVGLDLESGREMWRFHSVAHPATPGGDTWNDLPLEQRSGGSVWVPGSYDPQLDLIYYGLAPAYDDSGLLHPAEKDGVSNSALYTNSTVALRPKTGELVWHYQHMANDQWDLDWVFERHLIEMPVNGEDRKVVLTAGKMALYDAVDAATGEYLFSLDMGLQNIVSGIDAESGAKTINANAVPNAVDTQLICPFDFGARNWQAASYNPLTEMLYLPLSDICMNAGPTGSDGLLSSGSGTPAARPASDGTFGRIQAVDLRERKLSWTYREQVPPTSAVLATAGGVVFAGASDETFKAFDATTGEILWQTELDDIPASFPISYSVDGKQYVAVVIGQSSLHANVVMEAVAGFIGDGNPFANLSRRGAAIVVYAID